MKTSKDPKKKINRLTVKIGTRVLTDGKNRIDEESLKSLSHQVCDLMDEGIEVIIVTSGAIASGLGFLDMTREGLSLSELQAIASIGQNHLMDIYNRFFNERGYRTGQILLTQEDFNDRIRYLNIRYTLNTLFEYKAIPIINENDSVSTEEIKCGDNDRISGLVADLAGSDMLLILSNVQGLFDEKNELVHRVDKINKRIKSFCRGKSCKESTGGMATKLEAVDIATRAGVECFIADGRQEQVIKRVAESRDTGTCFSPRNKLIRARKRWIAYTKSPKGALVVDDGAVKALKERKKSLLPGGVVSVEGVFSAGDLVKVIDSERSVVAKGLSNYMSFEIEKIKGKKSREIESVLGYKDYDEVIHRDNLVII